MAKPLSKQDKQGIAIFAAAMLAVIALVVALFVARGSAGHYDRETLCPTDRDYAHTVVLIDKTDPFSATQQDYLRSRLKALRDRLAKYEKLSIFVLEDDGGTGAARFSLCNPGTGKDANELYQNPRLEAERFKTQFGAPLDSLLAELLVAQTKPHSAILEAIRDIAAQPDFHDPRQTRHLVIVSDLIQNVAEFSQYHSVVPFDVFAKTTYGEWMLRTPLAGVDVSVIYLLRQETKHSQTRAHALFWENYFSSLGAVLKELDPIQ